MASYETTFFDYFAAMRQQLKTQPILLGGGAGVGGGVGGPPGGFIGYLPQSRVAYDTTEAATLATDGSGTLVDNLNHIRSRILTLETTVSGGVDIEYNGVLIAEGVTIVDFISPLVATQTAATEVTITLSGEISSSYSGVYNEDKSPYVNGIDSHFDLDYPVYDYSIRVYLDSGRYNPNSVTLDSDAGGFTLGATPASGSLLIVDYDTPIPTAAHTHSQYLTSGDTYTRTQIDTFLIAKSETDHTHVETDVTDLEHNAIKIQGVVVSSGVPTDGQGLVYVASNNRWEPTTIPGLGVFQIKQQMLLTIGGVLDTTGVSPIAIYAHDVSGTITEIYASVNVAPISTDVRVNVLKNGTTIFNSPQYIEIPIGQFTASSTANFATTSFTKDDKFQIDLVQGDTSASDLVIHIRFYWEL